jgi:hypothetical protein
MSPYAPHSSKILIKFNKTIYRAWY